MSLTEYRKKRDFDQSPEPGPEVPADKGQIFVVQKHNASHLHYDFRLEIDGVLKSWAVPKGPSMNPHDKRLAVLVEDHPLDYATFEGTIPKGQYGAGTVEVWDHGVWTTDAKHGGMEQGVEHGVLDFSLHGSKLKGEFSLVELKNSYTKNGWLLIKKQDQYSVSEEYDANRIPSHP